MSALPNQLRDKILLTKHLIHQQPQVVHLIIVNAHENHAVLAQQLAGQEKARVHHGEPGGVVASAGLRVGGEQIALGVLLAGQLQVGGQRVGVVVGVDKIVAGVVRWVNVDHLHSAKVGLVEELEDFQVVALDEEVLGGVKVHGFLAAGDEGGASRGLEQADGVALAGPGEGVAFGAVVH